ncbi:unnamed protein product [Allacma fusca]|uniref:Uncharacterized protein n=1 Tax=Allacma fusca TaxID=39272 RepID=A0A8J2PSR6_9HEXA|nr:unnamed protein product [Allacma fusca]
MDTPCMAGHVEVGGDSDGVNAVNVETAGRKRKGGRNRLRICRRKEEEAERGSLSLGPPNSFTEERWTSYIKFGHLE